MASDCESIRKRLCAYLGHDLDWWEGEKINLHLQHCPSCDAVYHQFRARVERLRRELRDWACENRFPEGWNEEFQEGLFKALKNQRGFPRNGKDAVSRERRGLAGRARIKILLLFVGLFIFITIVSPFLCWLTLHLPFYGLLVKKFLLTII